MIKFKIDEEFGDSLVRYFPDNKAKMARTITFQVTDDCNLCCSYCYQINKGHHKMSFETAKKLGDKLDKIYFVCFVDREFEIYNNL